MRLLLAAVAVFAFAQPAASGVLGSIVRYDGLAASVAALPAERQKAWNTYLSRSGAAHQRDVDTLAAERAALAAIPPPVPSSFHDKSIPLDKYALWYASDEARREADIIVSFQTPAGGWGKNQDFTSAPRLKGQMWVAAEFPVPTSAKDFAIPDTGAWHYVGTIDNDATYLQLAFLAKVIAAAKPDESAAWRASFLKGVDYLLAAEFPGGGWPQIWPLAGGYHDALTYNDNAFVNSATLLAQVATGDLGFVPMEKRLEAAAAVRRAEALVLATQVVVNGRRTVWAQQYDATTLKPVAARNFEPAALSSTESADLLMFLMSDPDPSPAVIAAVHDGVAFLKSVAIKDKAWKKGTMGDAPGALLWARFYDPVGFKPVFGDRDMTIHDSVNDLSEERRQGYSWYNTGAAKALKKYQSWSAEHPVP